MLVSIQWTAKWIYSEDGIHVSTVQKFLNRCKEEFQDQIEILKSDLCACEFKLETSGQYPGSQILELLNEFVKIEDFDDVCTIAIEEEEPEKTDETPAPQPAAEEPEKAETPKSEAEEPAKKAEEPTEEPTEKPAEMPKNPSLSKVEELIGAEEFKALCRELALRADRAQKHNTKAVIFSTAYVLFLGKGCDIDDYTALLTGLLVEKKLFSKASPRLKTVVLPKLPLEKSVISQMEEITDKIREGYSGSTVVAIDFSEWAAQTDSKYFKLLLQAIAACRESENLFVFHCEMQSEKIRKKIVADFRDLLLTKSVTIRELTDDELLKATERGLDAYGYKLSEAAKTLFRKKLDVERADGYFYGLKTAGKIVNEMIDAHETSAEAETDEITEADVKAILEIGQQENTAEKMLSRLYGMDSVKQQVTDICNQIAYAREHGIKLPCLHMKFVGNPGTGKTTMARVVGMMLKESGTLRVGNFYEYHARDLCGQYIGQTAVLTHEACARAYGSVLFIDEAYALYRSKDNGKDFGQEAIDTLIAEMENHSDDLLVIFAGYPDEMDLFTNANPGLKSRIPFTIHFPNYSADELFYIFEKMASREFQCSKEFLDAAKRHFLELAAKIKDEKSFGNARYVRNLYERTWGYAAKRAAEQGSDALELLPADLQKAIAELADGEGKAPKDEPPKVGFI